MAIRGGVQNLNEGIVRSIAYQVSIKGTGVLADLANAQAKVAAETMRYQTMMASVPARTQEAQKQLARLANEWAHLEAMIKLVTEASRTGGQVTDELVARMKKQEGQSQRTSYALFQVAYAIDDLQYGLPALTNNIVGIATGMAQMAGASQESMKYITGLSVVVVAASVAYNNWDKIVAKLGNMLGVDSPLKTARQEMEDLKKETNLTAEKQERLNELTERFGAIAAVAKIKSQGSEDQTEAFDKAMKTLPGAGEKFEKDLRAVLSKEAEATIDPQARKDIQEQKARVAEQAKILAERQNDGFSSSLVISAAERELKILQNQLKTMEEAYETRIKGAVDPRIGAILNEARTTGPGLDALREKVRANAGKFDPGAEQALASATKEARDKERDDKIDAELAEEKRQTALRLRQDNAKARADMIKEHAEALSGADIKQRAETGGTGMDEAAIQEALRTKRGVQGAKFISAEVGILLDEMFEDAVAKMQKEMGRSRGVVASRAEAIQEIQNKAVEESIRQAEAEQKKILDEQNRADREKAAATRAQNKLLLEQNKRIKDAVEGAAPGMRKVATIAMNKGATPEQMREVVKTALAKEVGVPPDLLDEAADLVMGGAEKAVAGLAALRAMGVAAKGVGAGMGGGGGGGFGGGGFGGAARQVDVAPPPLMEAPDFDPGLSGMVGGRRRMGMVAGAGAAAEAMGAMDDTDPSKPFREKAGESRAARLERLLIWKKRKRDMKSGAREERAGAVNVPGGMSVSDVPDLSVTPVAPNISPPPRADEDALKASRDRFIGGDNQATNERLDKTNEHLAAIRQGVKAEVTV